MANNRMYLVCRRCAEEEATTFEECVLFLAKYYPTTGWYLRASPSLVEAVDAWFDLHIHGDMYGEFITLLYEGQISEVAHDKREILNALADVVRKQVHDA
jgi:hypothetical protein